MEPGDPVIISRTFAVDDAVEVMQIERTARGKERGRVADGWVSFVSGSGKALLELVAPAQPGDADGEGKGKVPVGAPAGEAGGTGDVKGKGKGKAKGKGKDPHKGKGKVPPPPPPPPPPLGSEPKEAKDRMRQLRWEVRRET